MIAIDTIACKMASLVPNMAYVVDAQKPGITQKAGWRDIGFATTGTEIAPANGYRPNRDWAGAWASPGFGGSTGSFLTMGAYRSKALSVVKPHEELEPLESDHPLRQLLENPNPQDTSFDLGYEQVMFGELCGVDYLWTPLNRWGRPAECYVLPSHWVWPRTGGGKYANPENPHADELIQWYEVRPWGGMGSAGILRIPPNEIIRTSWKSPINKIDGYSKLWAIAQWIDTEESIAKSRWSQMINQARPEFWVELGPGYDDPSDDRIARMEAKFGAKFQGEYNYGKPIFTPSGAKVTPLSFSPTEMAYFQSEEQVRDTILATWRVPGAAVGLVKEMTYGSILATLLSLCTYALNPRLAMRGLTLTKHLAKHWDEDTPAYSTFDGAGGRSGWRRVRIWWDDCAPADPQQVNADLAEDRANYAITPNEVRALRGRKNYRFGGDDPIVQGPGGVMPFPMNTQEDLSWLAEKIAPMTQSQGQASEESVDPSTGKLLGEQLDGEENGKPANNLPVDGEAEEIEGQETPKIENPNGKPQKSLDGSQSEERRVINGKEVIFWYEGDRWFWRIAGSKVRNGPYWKLSMAVTDAKAKVEKSIHKKHKPPAEIDEELLREVEAIVPAVMPRVVPQQLGVIRGLKIIVVDGDWVKQEYSMDFVEAGNGQRYDYIPKDEIWVDCNIALHDWVPNLYHELTEVPLMAAGEDYEQAHRTANVGENLAREEMHPINRLKLLESGIRKNGYFEDCDRDDEGHCLPSGQGGSGAGKPSGGAATAVKPKPKKPESQPATSSHPGSTHGSTVKVKKTSKRAFDGATPAQTKTTLTKQETGRVGEAVVLAFLQTVAGRKDAKPMNAKMTNFPIDLIEDHAPTEVKAGLVSNGPDAQKWRLTFSKESKKEKAAYAKMSQKQRAAWNAEKQSRIRQRKEQAIKELEAATGKKIKPRTMTVVINPDTRTADVYEFEGWHDIIRWRSEAAKRAYKGSVTYA